MSRCPHCGNDQTKIIHDVSCEEYEGGRTINHVEVCTQCNAKRLIDEVHSDHSISIVNNLHEWCYENFIPQ